jgi:hypothetical protein
MAVIDRPEGVPEPPHFPEQDWTEGQLTEWFEANVGPIDEVMDAVFGPDERISHQGGQHWPEP